VTISNEAENLTGPAGEPEEFGPEETTDQYFVIVPLWVLEAVSGEAVKLYGVLASYLNSNSRIVWPSRQTLAGRLGKSRPESIDRYLAELSRIGAVTVVKRYRPDGGQTSSAYRIHRIPPREIPRGGAPKTAQGGALKTAHEEEPIKNLEEKDPRSARVPKEAPAEQVVPTISPTVDNSQPELAIFEPDVVAAALAKIEADPFAEFWRIYPRKDDKKRAEKAFRKALQDGVDSAAILAGALRYRQDPNREPRYTKQPATWLNAGSWDNGALPARGGARPNLEDKLATTAALSGHMVQAWARTFGGSQPTGQLALDSTRN
jgi:hypothetical protein